jgi:hypothetical protein
VFQRFQSSVDRNYDKFDLYVTKNVLNQPEDIVFPNVCSAAARARSSFLLAPWGSSLLTS